METDAEIKKIEDTLEGIRNVVGDTVKQEVMSKFEESQTETEKEIKRIKNTIQKIDNSFRNVVDDTVKKKVRSHITDELDELQRTMAVSNNIILYRIPENNSVMGATRLREDTRFCEQFLN